MYLKVLPVSYLKAFKEKQSIMVPIFAKTEHKCSSILAMLPFFCNCFFPLWPTILNYVLFTIGAAHSHKIVKSLCVHISVLKSAC